MILERPWVRGQGLNVILQRYVEDLDATPAPEGFLDWLGIKLDRP
jgi:hypothetical protein